MPDERSALSMSALPPAHPRRASAAAGSERRREPRHSAAGRVRLWLLEQLGFVEGGLADLSRHGLRFNVARVLTARCLGPGDCRRVEVYGERGDSFSAIAQVRHVTSHSIGLAVVEPVPIELFDRPASPS